MEDLFLIGPGQTPVKGQNDGVRKTGFLQPGDGFPDVVFRGHEDQNIPAKAFASEGGNGLSGQIHCRGFFRRFGIRRAISDVHRIGPACHFDHGRIVKRPGKAFRIDGRRGDDEF